jgi:hypothetical protein
MTTSSDACLKYCTRAFNVCYGQPFNSKTLCTLAVQGRCAGNWRPAQGSGNLGTVTRLADFSRGSPAVISGMYINTELREETAHGNVAIKDTVEKRHMFGV